MTLHDGLSFIQHILISVKIQKNEDMEHTFLRQMHILYLGDNSAQAFEGVLPKIRANMTTKK
jgi:hypothetical protein